MRDNRMPRSRLQSFLEFDHLLCSALVGKKTSGNCKQRVGRGSGTPLEALKLF